MLLKLPWAVRHSCWCLGLCRYAICTQVQRVRSCSGMQGSSCGFRQCMSSVVPARTLSSSHFIPHSPHVVATVLLSVFWGNLMPAVHAHLPVHVICVALLAPALQAPCRQLLMCARCMCCRRMLQLKPSLLATKQHNLPCSNPQTAAMEQQQLACRQLCRYLLGLQHPCKPAAITRSVHTMSFKWCVAGMCLRNRLQGTLCTVLYALCYHSSG